MPLIGSTLRCGIPYQRRDRPKLACGVESRMLGPTKPKGVSQPRPKSFTPPPQKLCFWGSPAGYLETEKV